MRKTWTDRAWDDYLYWQTQDRKTLCKINRLVQDIERNGPRGAKVAACFESSARELGRTANSESESSSRTRP